MTESSPNPDPPPDRSAHLDGTLAATDADSAIYCPVCNAAFSGSTTGRCPQCGGDALAAPSTTFADTLLIKPANPPRTCDDETPNEFSPRGEDNLCGQTLGRFQLERLLGEGGMGQVYLAKHLDLERPSAVKVLSPRVIDSDVDYVRRFLHEGKAAAKLVHPNIVTVHDISQIENHHFLEMEFVAGETLQKHLQHEGRFPPLKATRLAVEVARGLAVAHEHGVIHRDLKADNILLTPRGVPKIADFGLAKRVRDEDGVPTDKMVGTPHYMAPELFSGQRANAVSDVYALGVCFFQMLTGRFPFTGKNLAELQHRVQTEPLPTVRGISPDITLEIAECVARLTDRSPANRPADGLEAQQLIEAVLGQVRDIDSLLTEAFTHLDMAACSRDGDRYRVHLDFEDGRHQNVFLETVEYDPLTKLLLIYSPCCPARGDYFEQALRLNSEIPHGALAIRNHDGTPHFVMIDTYPRSTLSADTVRRSVLEVGARADAIEKLLTGKDVN